MVRDSGIPVYGCAVQKRERWNTADAWRRSGLLLGDTPPDAPPLEDRIGAVEDEKAGAIDVVAVSEERIVIRHDVAHVGDQRQPDGGFRHGGVQAGAVEGVVDDGAELVLRNTRREVEQGGFESGAAGHESKPPLPACGERRDAKRPGEATQDETLPDNAPSPPLCLPRNLVARASPRTRGEELRHPFGSMSFTRALALAKSIWPAYFPRSAPIT